MEGEQGDFRVHKSIIRQRKEVLWMIHPSEKAEQVVAKFQFIDSIDLFAGQGNSTKMKLLVLLQSFPKNLF